ncbi:hypothetical protein CVT25_003800 [Psilocybe cyanescens]|uniref:Uncharacterized protein n=1 Tax=Psilocybe cyanescens TaxID=93625 RepID=A0A409WX97_PSICY|nr:hypothetical protein CVT25_003800 [Psilocybe cyanescens]
MLSQGLSASRPSEKLHQPMDISSSSKGRPDIDLAHARKKIPVDNDVSTTWFIPNPIHVSPSTPRSRRYMRERDAHTSSSNSNGRRSKILDALDTSQPLLMRRVIDEVLTMDDLAGLSGLRQSSISTASWRRDGLLPNSGHFVAAEMNCVGDRKTFDPRSKIEIEDIPCIRKHTPVRSRRSHVPSSRLGRFCYDTGPSFESRLLQSNKSHSNRYSSASISNVPFDRDDSSSNFEVEDSGYMKFIGDKNRASSPWSTKRRQSSSRTTDDVKYTHSDRASSYSSDHSPVDPDSDVYEALSAGNVEEEESHLSIKIETLCGTLPSSIRLGPIRAQYGDADSKISVFGSLFEQSNPWSAVGLILGLPEFRTDKKAPDQLLVDEGASQLDEDDCDCDSLFGVVWQSTNDEGYISNDDALVNVSWQNLIPDYGSTPMISSESVQRSPMALDYSDRLSMGRTEISPRHVEFIYEDLLEGQPECDRSILDPPDDTMLVHQSSILAQSEKTAVLEPRDDNADQVSMQAEETNFEKMTTENAERDGATIKIVIPELREINGRFFGPSLFNDFDESD